MKSDEIIYHIPVLKNESTKFLVTNKNGIYVDGTMGGGGHSEEILKIISKNGKLIAIDQDNDSHNFANKRLSKFQNQIYFVQNNFSNIKEVLQSLSIKKIDGILLDLGISSHQIDESTRGFAFMSDAKLDMRMNKLQNLSAFEIINNFSAKELQSIFFSFGEIRESKMISRMIEKSRIEKKIETTTDLRKLIESKFKGPNAIKLLARVFQSLRIAVNRELDALEICLRDVYEFLNPGARIVVISYHSLEDRIVKNFFKEKANPIVEKNYFSKSNFGKPELNILTKKPIEPSADEILKNSRSRSAKMRVAEKI